MKSKSTLLILLFLAGFINAQENYNLQMRGHLAFPGRELANIGGYVDSLGNEYALVGTNTGLSIVNVTKINNLKIVKFDMFEDPPKASKSDFTKHYSNHYQIKHMPLV